MLVFSDISLPCNQLGLDMNEPHVILFLRVKMDTVVKHLFTFYHIVLVVLQMLLMKKWVRFLLYL